MKERSGLTDRRLPAEKPFWSSCDCSLCGHERRQSDDENTVLLTGNVDSEQQHDLALRIAQSYAGDRKIVDKIKVTQAT